MNTLNGHAEQLARLYVALGDYTAGGRPDGIFTARLGGPGSVAGLADLDAPQLHLDLLPFPPTPEQRSILGNLGYTLAAEHMDCLIFTHPAALDAFLPSHDLGQSHRQQLLWAELADPSQQEARAEYRRVFLSAGREAADAALWPCACKSHLERTRFGPLERAHGLLDVLGLPWMFAAGWALDLHRQQVGHQGGAAGLPSRPHEDIDVIVERDAQMVVYDLLLEAGYTVHAVRDGMHTPADRPLEAPDFQVHAFSPAGEMLDLMLTDFSGTLPSDRRWHYRRDPAISLPLTRARRISLTGLPYLAPEAALLFKANVARGTVRPRDQQDFEGVLPALDAAARGWLAAHIGEGHAWQALLKGVEREDGWPVRTVNPE